MNIKKFLSPFSLVLTMLLVMSLSLTTFASKNTGPIVEKKDVESSESTKDRSSLIKGNGSIGNLSTGWTTVWSESPINRNVWIMIEDAGLGDRIDVRMLDQNWQEVWYGSNVIGLSWSLFNGWVGSGSFWCGSNVYHVQVRSSAIRGIVTASGR